MTTTIKITNIGSHSIMVNVWEADKDQEKNVERIELHPGQESLPITIYNWRRGVTVVETDTVDRDK